MSRAAALDKTREQIALLDDILRHPLPELHAEDVRSVLVILGGSRSGSSLLFSALAESGAFIAPQGEETPFYRLAGLGWVDHAKASDEIPGPWAPSKLQEVARNLLRDCGT